MARPKKNITVSKETLLSQPMALSLLPYNYNASKNQLKLINAIVRKLQVLIKHSIAQKRATGIPVDMRTFFDSAYNSRVLREEVLHKDDYVFDLHLSEFGVEPKRYPELYNELFKLGSIQAMLPFETEYGDRGVRPVPLFVPIFWETRGQRLDITDKDGKKVTIYKYDKKKPEITIAVPKAMAEQVFNLNGWIDHYLDYVVTNIDSGYTGRLYIYLSSKRKNSKTDVVFKENYDTFREIMGFIGTEKDKYPYYSDFRKRVLESSHKELKAKANTGDCDLWFDYEPIYTLQGGRTPSALQFTVHISALGKDNAEAKELRHRRATIEEYLRTHLGLSPKYASALTMADSEQPLTIAELKILEDKAKSLEDYIEKNNPTFKVSKRTYVYSVLYNDCLKKVILAARQSTANTSEKAESTPDILTRYGSAIYAAVTALRGNLTPDDYAHWAEPVITRQTPVDGATITVRYTGPWYRGKRARQSEAFCRVRAAIEHATGGHITDILAIHEDNGREQTI